MRFRLLLVGLLASACAFGQLNVTGSIAASQVTSGQFNISLIPTGTNSTTVALGNDSRFLNATSLNGTSITSLTGILKLSSGTPSNAAAADLIALWSGSCSSTTYLRGDGSCATPGGGSVTSVALSAPNIFSVSGSPVTSSGTLALGYATGLTSNENQVFGVNASGAAGLMAITNAMMPAPTVSALGGIQAINAVSHQWVNSINTSGVPQLSQPAFSDISGAVAASQLPNPGASTLGGIESFASVSHQWINSISTSGMPSASQPSFGDISGTIGAAQLPSPGASTLGGVESATAGANQFMTGISTSGIPQFSQPSFANLSGTAAAAQMPTSVPVWTKYTIPYTSVQTSSTSNAVTIVSLTAGQAVCGLVEKHTTAFAGTSISGLTVTIGDSNGTSTTYSPVAFNLLQTVSNTAFVANNVVGMASFAGGNIQANFTSSGANLSALTAGSLNVDVCIVSLP